jgi:hypothetical protein
MHRADFGEQMAVGYRHKVGKLHEGDGVTARECLAGGETEDGVFRQWGIVHLFGEIGGESTGETKYIAFGIFDILPEQGGFPIFGEPRFEGFAHGFEHAEVPIFGSSEIFFVRFWEWFLGIEDGFGGGAFAGGMEGGVDLFFYFVFN